MKLDENSNIEQFKKDLVSFLDLNYDKISGKSVDILFDITDLLLYASELMYSSSKYINNGCVDDAEFFEEYKLSTHEFFERSKIKKISTKMNK